MAEQLLRHVKALVLSALAVIARKIAKDIILSVQAFFSTQQSR